MILRSACTCMYVEVLGWVIVILSTFVLIYINVILAERGFILASVKEYQKNWKKEELLFLFNQC